MEIFDLTALLATLPQSPLGQPPDEEYVEESFLCNNSLQHWKDDMYIMTYRTIRYGLPKEHFRPRSSSEFSWPPPPGEKEMCHPWKMWDNGYKFMLQDPDRFQLFPPWSFQKPSRTKYRTFYSADLFIDITENPHHYRLQHSSRSFSLLSSVGEELDTTSLVILQYRPHHPDQVWNVVYYVEHLFEHDMNQDVRLYHHEHNQDEFLVTYNGYMNQNPDPHQSWNASFRTEMLKRRLILCWRDRFKFIYLSEERPLLYHHPKRIEKNCIFHNDNVLYKLSLQDGFTIQRPTDTLEKPPNRLWSQFHQLLVQQFGTDTPLPLISLGSAPLRYHVTGRWLMTAHLKIPFRAGTYKDTIPMLRNVEWSTIYQHGKCIYFLFLIEFNDDYDLKRISSAFIPTNQQQSHLPFLLCFSTGLCYGRNEDEILLSYGEGDVRTKIVSLIPAYIENLMYTADELSVLPTYPFDYLNVDEFKKRSRIYYYGYCHERNAGDDAFTLMFRYLHRQAMAVLAPHGNHPFFFFFNEMYTPPKESENVRALVFGGGDIINPYFLQCFEKFALHDFPSMAVSVGIPYLQHTPWLRHFQEIVLRNPRDVVHVKHILSSHVPGPHVYTFPDLVFGLCHLPHVPYQYRHLLYDSHTLQHRKRVGLNVCRTYYERESHNYISFIPSLAQSIQGFLDTDDTITLVTIPFGTSTRNHKEDDRVIHKHIGEFLHRRYNCRMVDITSHPLFHNDLDNVAFLYESISSLDFLICTRFHAHVFAIMTGTPFVSLSCSRKCRELMADYELQDLCLPLVADKNGKPYPISDPQRLSEWLVQQYQCREETTQRLRHVWKHRIEPGVSQFQRYWLHWLQQVIRPPSPVVDPHDNDKNHHDNGSPTS